ncbi:hypothetical protein, partial [Roseovarius sp. SYSU LYC5161]|uniref:hypothetical protein n=1 Tax=Roseovarius halophilus (ex Wu et al. 2025) TaxID=3376060 RepID=UPI0039995058
RDSSTMIRAEHPTSGMRPFEVMNCADLGDVGPILPLITGMPDTGHACHERHVCVDTTAAGGNAALLGGMS